jgi:UTP:GlnB (protein PII) uridylyltransferase
LFRSVTEVTLYTADHPGLFARVAGAMSVCGASIVDAKIFTTTERCEQPVVNTGEEILLKATDGTRCAKNCFADALFIKSD